MRVCLPAALILTLVPSLAAGQTDTNAGVRALLGGDYPAAVRILRPLADEAATPDPVAQFFMAILYEAGRGVERDSVRACGLFGQAAAPANPFMEQASALASGMRQQFGPNRDFCGLIGGGRGQAPAPFTFQPNHPLITLATLNGTVDGVAALINGDVQRAADILLPNAEQWRAPDFIAKFFMATMYEYGARCAAGSAARVCALSRHVSRWRPLRTAGGHSLQATVAAP